MYQDSIILTLQDSKHFSHNRLWFNFGWYWSSDLYTLGKQPKREIALICFLSTNCSLVKNDNFTKDAEISIHVAEILQPPLDHDSYNTVST